MMWLIIGCVALAFFLLLCFAFGVKDAVLMTCYTIKSVALHLLESVTYVATAFILALFRFEIALFGFIVMCFACFSNIDKNVAVVLFLLFMIIYIRNLICNLRECFYYKPYRHCFALADKWISFGNPDFYCFEETKWC